MTPLLTTSLMSSFNLLTGFDLRSGPAKLPKNNGLMDLYYAMAKPGFSEVGKQHTSNGGLVAWLSKNCLAKQRLQVRLAAKSSSSCMWMCCTAAHH